MLAPAVDRLGRTPDPENPGYLQQLEFESIKQTMKNLRSFPMVQILERRGFLHLHAAYFSVRFEPIAEKAHAAAFLEARF